MRLDVIEERSNYIKIIFTGLLIIWLLIDVTFNQGNSIYVIVMCFSIGGALELFEQLSIRKVGILTLNDTYCEVNKNIGETFHYDYANIQHIIIDQLRYLEGAIPAKSKIILKITIQELEKEKAFIMLLRGKKAKAEMTELLKTLYKNKVSVKEYDMNGSKSFLFRPNLSYNEIQQIKREYNLS